MQQPDRIVIDQLPAIGIERPEHLIGPRRPRPAIVVGDPGKRCQLLREPRRQVIGRVVDVGTSIAGGQVHALGHRRRW